MTFLILTHWADFFDEIVVIFANTGEENEATLVFAQQCSEWFRSLGARVVWVEAVVNHRGRGRGYGTSHRVVTFETASRNGEPFREVIKKYGIPNPKNPLCTRELKQRPLYSYVSAELGWKKGTYKAAIGIRADEIDRCENDPDLWYPLAFVLPLWKSDVNTFWAMRSFRLQLAGYQGNCKTCHKKSLRKLLTIMDENPRAFDFNAEMERDFGRVGPEFARPQPAEYKRVFFRGRMSTDDLRRAYLLTDWESASNDAVVYSGQRIPLDADDGCVESCEVRWSEAIEE